MQALRPLARILEFHGRSGRAEYWQWVALTTIITATLATVEASLNPAPGDTLAHPSRIFLYTTTLPSWSVAVRRLHDRNMSGWWYMALAGSALLFAALFAAAEYQEGQPNGDTLAGLALITAVISIGLLGYLLIQFALPGDAQSNRYGPPDAPSVSLSQREDGSVMSSARIEPSINFDDALTSIERLGVLRDKGLITESEFETQKARLLSK